MKTSLQKTIIRGYLMAHLFSLPFWGLFLLLPMILYRDLQVTPFQMTAFVACKPLASLFSPYWSQYVHNNQNKLKTNLYWANLLKHLPFFFVPFFNSPYFYILACGFYMSFSRGTIPAWMELLKLHLSPKECNKICSFALTLDYVGSALFPLCLGVVLDHFDQAWRWLFPMLALIGLFSLYYLLKIPSPPSSTPPPSDSPLSYLLKPWTSCWNVLNSRRDFLNFQIGFFLGGAGLMIVQPILPSFFVDSLHLSYTGISGAIATMKGIGFALASPTWVRFCNTKNIYSLSACVSLLAACSLLFLISTPALPLLLYLSYFLYGIMQSGSELSWRMSGALFSKNENSAPFSSINVLAVGLRGLLFPALGAFLLEVTGHASWVVLLGGTCCLFSAFFMFQFSKRHPAGVNLSE
ncbi:MAG: hypothetical protein A2Y28_02915 [Chlamydiae bacterium GWC2_50_10]|nr:MAG: hypothetical protein A2Y28_02915 [Chlamydiae bacterium GWC2_50_10]